MPLVPGKFAHLLKLPDQIKVTHGYIQEPSEYKLGFTVSKHMLDDDIYGEIYPGKIIHGADMNYEKMNAFASGMQAGLGPLVAQAPPENEPFPDKLPEVGPETKWQRIWREMWGLMTAEEDWQKRYKPVIKWYRLHYALTRQAREGEKSVARRFAVGWYDFDTDVWHYYVMPLNVIVVITRKLFHLIAYKIPRGIIERQAGYYFRAGYKSGFTAAAKELDKHNLLGQKPPRNFPFHAPHPHSTATQMAQTMHKADSEFEQKMHAITEKVKQEIEQELYAKFAHMYVGVDPSTKPHYTTQFMNDPIPFPTAIKKPPPIEAGAPVGVNAAGHVYALTDVDLAAHLYGFALGMPDAEGFVLVKTSHNTVTKIKAIPSHPSLEAKHED